MLADFRPYDVSLFLAAIPEPHTILGVRLFPFSAGHLLLLNRIQNRFAALANMEPIDSFCPGADDLFTGVWFCRGSYAEGVRMLSEPVETARAMGEWIAAYSEKCGAVNVGEKCVAFAAYIRAGCGRPQYAPKINDRAEAHEVQVPPLEVVKLTLLKARAVQSEAEFLERPWGLSLWDYFTVRALRGDGQIYSEDAIADALEAGRAAQTENDLTGGNGGNGEGMGEKGEDKKGTPGGDTRPTGGIKKKRRGKKDRGVK